VLFFRFLSDAKCPGRGSHFMYGNKKGVESIHRMQANLKKNMIILEDSMQIGFTNPRESTNSGNHEFKLSISWQNIAVRTGLEKKVRMALSTGPG
jgi:hypothetical protein